MRILTAEDNRTNQLVFRKMVQTFCVDLEFADNGHEAVDKWRAWAPDLLFMDISMPEVDGIEATSEIRAIQRARGATKPIIGVTAHAMRDDRQRCFDAGMDDYLSKPVKRDALEEMLRTHLSGRVALAV